VSVFFTSVVYAKSEIIIAWHLASGALRLFLRDQQQHLHNACIFSPNDSCP